MTLATLHKNFRRYRHSGTRREILIWMDARDRLALYYAVVGMART